MTDETLTVTLVHENGAPAARLPALRLSVVKGPDAGARYVPKRDRFTIGTHESADLRLNDKAVSRFHCEVSLEDGRLAVRDTGSRNGTRIGGVQIVHAFLPPGQRLELGESALELTVGAASEGAALPLSKADRFGGLVGSSVPMRAAFALLERAAQSNATVLLDGETGTGKEAAAEALHEHGPRKGRPFIVVDCGAVPVPLIESELFGHEKGAFTGAVGARVGAFEAANGGTLFLDEIGELPLEVQPKLLRALEKREVKRVGATKYQAVDVRVIAATHRSLKAEVNAGTFRADLYFRLAVLEVRLPALRERREDVPALVAELLKGLGLPDSALLTTPQAQAYLKSHPWPGNVRELRNYLERCVALGALPPLEGGATEPSPSGLKEARAQAQSKFERLYLEELLQRSNDNVSQAARDAGVDRKYLYRLLRRHGLR